MSFFGIPMRNGLPLGLGTVASLTNGPGFLPSELFYNGTVQGAWYDPSDLTTLFQDSAGTTPVTAVEQAVGLMLDKSKGLVLGPELVTNGDFSNGTTGWSAPAGQTLTVENGAGKALNTSTGAYLGAPIAVVSGTWYKFTYTAISDGTSKSVGAALGSAVGTGTYLSQTDTGGYAFGTRTFYWLATVTGTVFPWFFAGSQTGTNYILIDNVTVQAIAGNHAYQSTSASRPTLRARYNLLTRSEEFNDAAWTTFAGSATVSANAAVAPDGTTTADKLIASTTSGNQLIRQAPTSAAGTYVFSCYMKNDGYNQGALIVWDNIAAQFATILFNLTNGTITTGTIGNGGNQGIANLSGAVVSLPNGWFRCAVTFTTTSTTINVYPGVYNATTFGGNGLPTAWAGNGTSGILVWGAQLTATAVFPSNTYQRIGAATDYATGAAFPPYLFFDGTDDSMLTNSVDFATVTSDGQARRNLLLNPTQFDTASWTKDSCTISANATTAPDGTITADKVVSAAATAATGVSQSIGTNSGQFTQSWFVKQAEVRYVQLLWSGGASAEYANFDLQTGVVTQTTAAVTPTISAAANGFYRITLTSTLASATVIAYCWAIGSGTTGRAGTYAGNGVDGFFIWGAQLETGSTATAFQNIGTDKMLVVAGVTKSSDAAVALLAELSASLSANNGSFWVGAPIGGGLGNYEFRSKGTADQAAITPSSFSAPITNVFTGIGNIGGSVAQARVNGSVSATNTGSQGTGNYGNYPLFIGSRNSSAFRFNGNIYSLIIAGQSYSSGQISSTESWVAAKTPLGTI